MSRPRTDDRLRDLHAQALQEFDQIIDRCGRERKQCYEDRRFNAVPGAQWDGSLADQFENKPQFEVNKINLACLRIDNEYRNNRIDMDWVSEDGTDPEGLDDTKAALYRADVERPCAQEAHDNAFSDMVVGGMGAWRLRADYEDPSDDDHDYQRIYIEPIFDPESSVYFLDSRSRLGLGATKAFLLTTMSTDQYREKYDEEPVSWDKRQYGCVFDWVDGAAVHVAEYYVVEQRPRIVHIYRGYEDEERRYSDEELERDLALPGFLAAVGFKQTGQKKTMVPRVHKYELSGSRVLKDCGYVPGRYIPIVVCYGKRTVINNVEYLMGQVRLAKDAQRLKNMLVSRLAEIAATSTTKKPILLAEQYEGHQDEWASANILNSPVYTINTLYDANGQPIPQGPVGYTEPADIPPPMALLMQSSEADLRDILGNPQEAEKLISNIGEKTQAAVKAILDMQTFGYLDNMRIAREWEACIWESMSCELYVEAGRKMRGLTSTGDAQSVELMRPELSKEGEFRYGNNLAGKRLRPIGSAGPASHTKRQKLFDDVIGLLQLPNLDPETASVLTGFALMNLEGEGVNDLRAFFRRKLVQVGAVKPTDEERQELEQQAAAQAQQPPDPQTQYLLAAAEQAQSEGASARASTILKVSQAQKAQADATKTMSEVGVSARKAATETFEALQRQTQPAAP